jgi:hypothetical protein
MTSDIQVISYVQNLKKESRCEEDVRYVLSLRTLQYLDTGQTMLPDVQSYKEDVRYVLSLRTLQYLDTGQTMLPDVQSYKISAVI